MQIDVLTKAITDCVYSDTTQIKDIAKSFQKYDDILIFGTGGSSLGSKALISLKSGICNKKNNIKFFENVDAQSFLNKLSLINKKNCGIIVISKSGNTTETIMLFSTLLEMWPDFDYATNAVAITIDSDNELHKIAKQHSIQIINHPQYIGGRFSVFSIVGLLPSCIFGIDIDQFLKGAQFAIENGINIEEMCTQIKNGINQHVIFCYSDYLCDFGKWCVQLISESLGKRKDFGITPINAIGTIDQHSMLQLFLGGPKDKMYSIVTQNIQPKTVALLNGNMAGYNIGDLMLAHQKSTIDILRKNAYTQVFAYDQFNEYNMGHLMMVFVLQTIEIAKHFNINPFDQPAVEASKSAILQNLCLLHK